MALSGITLASVDEQIKMLGVGPQILPRLQVLLSDANTNPDEILDLIRLDTALAAQVIKASNTAYFSRGFRIANIEDAVTYLGYEEVYRIMTLLAFGRLMREPLRHFRLDAGALWRRALACALAMDGLARSCGTDKRVAYTVGLLHAIGMIFVDRQLVASKAVVAGEEPVERTVRLLGLSHAEVGAYVLRQWNFPDEIVEPVRCQFEPLDCLSKGRLACLLATAKPVMAHITRPMGDVSPPAAPDPLVMTMLNLTTEEFDEIREETEGKFTLLEIATSDF